MTDLLRLPRGIGKNRARLRGEARLAVLMGIILLFSPTFGGAQNKPVAPTPAAAPPSATYVGSDTCQACHEDIFNAFRKNPHHLVETDKKYRYQTKSCESCHGPGSKHAESTSAADIRNPAKLKPAEADRVCLTCHLNQPTNVGRILGSHFKNEVPCVTCHPIHKNGPNGLVARKMTEINKQCSWCHTPEWASFQRPYRHRLPEGAMSCVDCHNPHGSVLPASLQTVRANEPGCFKCHGDLAGPFPYPHPPVQMEGCAACHEPHGSANPRMLTRAQVYYVCLECHANLPAPTPPPNGTLGTVPPSFHDLRSPRYQNCNICHQKVHGSYVDRALLK